MNDVLIPIGVCYQVAFYGKASRVLNFFESVGLVCDPHFNPADFICKFIH